MIFFPLCIANNMYSILITLEIILITDIRQVISNSGMCKIQINMKSFHSTLYKLLGCEAAHRINTSLFFILLEL